MVYTRVLEVHGLHTDNHLNCQVGRSMNCKIMLGASGLLVLALGFMPFVAVAEEGLLQASGMGTVDSAKVRNKVQGKLLSKRAATVDAQRNLLEMIEGVRLTSGTTVKDAQLQSDLIANRVKGLLQGAFVIKEDVSEDQGDFLAEVILGVCLDNNPPECKSRDSLASMLADVPPGNVPPGNVPPGNVPPATLPPQAATAQQPAPIIHQMADRTSSERSDGDGVIERYSGLIIEMGETDFTAPAVFKLVTRDGAVVYSPQHASALQGQDWVHWAASTDIARGMTATIGAKPLVIRAAGVTDQADILLNDGDALGIYEANLGNTNFLGQGKVVIVMAASQP